mmetsp:Transcript_73577/g.196065  ORF Transcript_73577/g.196065 Transcript_73577/m.196065 type:complete len:186 (-) Transcript_73577:366-923(-)
MSSDTLTLRGTLKGHGDWITSLATTPEDPNLLLSSSRDKSVIAWHLTHSSSGEDDSYGYAVVPCVDIRTLFRTLSFRPTVPLPFLPVGIPNSACGISPLAKPLAASLATRRMCSPSPFPLTTVKLFLDLAMPLSVCGTLWESASTPSVETPKAILNGSLVFAFLLRSPCHSLSLLDGTVSSKCGT